METDGRFVFIFHNLLIPFGIIYRPVYIESRVCVVTEAVMCSFEYWCVVYHTPSWTNYIALNKRLK